MGARALAMHCEDTPWVGAALCRGHVLCFRASFWSEECRPAPRAASALSGLGRQQRAVGRTGAVRCIGAHCFAQAEAQHASPSPYTSSFNEHQISSPVDLDISAGNALSAAPRTAPRTAHSAHIPALPFLASPAFNSWRRVTLSQMVSSRLERCV